MDSRGASSAMDEKAWMESGGAGGALEVLSDAIGHRVAVYCGRDLNIPISALS